MEILPPRRLIEEAIEACGFSEDRAIELLQVYGNDVESVKRHHHVMQSYEHPEATQPQEPLTLNTLNDSASAAIFGNPVHSLPCSRRSTQVNTPSTDATNMMDLGGPIGQPARETPSASPPNGAEDANNQRRWDFILPVLEFPEVHAEDPDFDPATLARLVQHSAWLHDIRRYLNIFKPADVKRDINGSVMGLSPIFYAVATYDVNLVRLLIQFGAHVNVCHAPSQTPLLAFAIVRGETREIDTTLMVCTLLSLGASPLNIPEPLFSPYLRDTAAMTDEDLSTEHSPDNDSPTAWCSAESVAQLRAFMNLTHRYFLHKATKLKPPTTRQRQVTRLRRAEDLLGVPYFLVGQGVATDVLVQQLIRHISMPTVRPLVLCFAGPSGHGKTELARQLGRLLSLNLEVVDCTVVTREIELFGPRPPYQGHDQGSAVNNFLSANSGKRCIVFLDEFEKTTREIHQSLLLPFDNGEYQDRRTGLKIDCSNTIWILATNSLDDEIENFYKHSHEEICSDERDVRSRSARKLSDQLRESFLQMFGGPVTGRISDFIPFLPFSTGEQAVITHKYLLELQRELRLPVDLSRPGEERFVGDIRLKICKDAALCTMLAKQHYHTHLGARSLIEGSRKVKHIVLDKYLDEGQEIRVSSGIVDYVVDLVDEEITAKKWTPRAMD